MINALLNYYEKCHYKKQGIILTLQHDKSCGWQLCIYDRVRGETIFDSDSTSLNKLSAEAYLALDEWAREFKDLENIECNLEIF